MDEHSRRIDLPTTSAPRRLCVAAGARLRWAVAAGALLLSAAAGAASFGVSLSGVANVYAFQNNGSSPPAGGFDNDGYAYSVQLTGSSLSWNGMTFVFGAAGTRSAASNTTVPLNAGQFASLTLIGAAVNGSQSDQRFIVHYADGSQTQFSQSLSDWCIPQSYPGETQVSKQSYRVTPSGATGGCGTYMYAYTFTLDGSKTVQSLQLPANRNVVMVAIDLSAQDAGAGGTGAPDHYAVATPGTAVNCQPAPVSIAAHDASHALVGTTNAIALSTSTGHGDWSLAGGAGTFTAGALNSGTASYTFAPSDAGTVNLLLRDTYAETLRIGATDGYATTTSGSALAAEDAPLTFTASGFRFTNGNNTPVMIGTQVAGVTSTQPLALQAVRTDTQTGACTAVFASGATVTVGLGYQCNNPRSCAAAQTLAITNNGASTALAANPGSGMANYTPVALKFSTANAEAPLSLSFSDVGQLTLTARYSIPLANGGGSGNVMSGAGQFVVQPYTLKLSAIARGSDGYANPGASTAAGPVFIAAGQPFSATVTAVNAQGAPTPNFGQELAPAAVSLTPALMLPAAGHVPPVSGGFGAYANGSASGSSFNWPEVGIVTLTPTVADYLGSGAVNGTPSPPVGRFVPNGFAVALNTTLIGTACAAGGFSYIGQPLTYTVAPMVTATAQALGGATTQNYTGAFLRVNNSTLSGRNYSVLANNPPLLLNGLPPVTADPAVADLGGGLFTLTFSAGSGLLFSRGAPLAPFNAGIILAINLLDADGVAAAANPLSFGAGSGMAFSTGATQYFGRLSLGNALGSELLDLPMPLLAQFYLSPTQGFVTNSSDVCSVAPTISFGNFQGNLRAGALCVRDSGSPGASGAGCATTTTNRYLPTAVAGGFNLILAAPGGGNSGAAGVSATAPSWLQYPWNTASGQFTSPLGLAVFGLFPGSASRIYQNEVY